MKVIFLDIDGVLNTFKTRSEQERVGGFEAYRRNPIHKAFVGELSRVLEATGARIVWSSTWRRWHSPEALDRRLAALGCVTTSLGSTPLLGSPRAVEIRAWLKVHPEVTHFVTIDDDPSAAVTPETHVECWDATVDGGGLDAECADQAIRILGAELERRSA